MLINTLFFATSPHFGISSASNFCSSMYLLRPCLSVYAHRVTSYLATHPPSTHITASKKADVTWTFVLLFSLFSFSSSSTAAAMQCNPTNQRWHAKRKLSWNTYAFGIYPHCIHVFARLVPICMLSRCLWTKISASELTRSALLVGNAILSPHGNAQISSLRSSLPTALIRKKKKKEEVTFATKNRKKHSWGTPQKDNKQHVLSKTKLHFSKNVFFCDVVGENLSHRKERKWDFEVLTTTTTVAITQCFPFHSFLLTQKVLFLLLLKYFSPFFLGKKKSLLLTLKPEKLWKSFPKKEEEGQAGKIFFGKNARQLGAIFLLLLLLLLTS